MRSMCKELKALPDEAEPLGNSEEGRFLLDAADIRHKCNIEIKNAILGILDKHGVCVYTQTEDDIDCSVQDIVSEAVGAQEMECQQKLEDRELGDE